MSPCDILIIGGGPAGLRAAEAASAAGLHTLLADRMPSVGRKFLVAGRGGLNLTHSEPAGRFPARYGAEPDRWRDLLARFSTGDLRAWAAGLGIDTFVGTSGRVFPVTKQAAPLLRRWVARLRGQGVAFRLHHRLTGLRARADGGGWEADFSTPQGPATLAARAVILALGGASWPQTGSDGAWTGLLTAHGIAVTPLAPANCGWEAAWPAPFLAEAEGLPLKNITVRCGDTAPIPGELLITRYGLEGGAIYQIGRALRAQDHPRLLLDLKPAFSADALRAKIPARETAPTPAAAARAWRLGPAARALLKLHAPFDTWDRPVRLAKALPVDLLRPRPIDEAISTAGGVAWDELDDGLMLRRLPGLFCAGEMVDWDAPTGGYLLQGCLATGTRAAQGAVAWLQKKR